MNLNDLVSGIAIITITLFLISDLHGQSFTLSKQSLHKIAKAPLGRERIIAYYRLAKKDSIKFEKVQRRNFLHQVDSTYLANLNPPPMDSSMVVMSELVSQTSSDLEHKITNQIPLDSSLPWASEIDERMPGSAELPEDLIDPHATALTNLNYDTLTTHLQSKVSDEVKSIIDPSLSRWKRLAGELSNFKAGLLTKGKDSANSILRNQRTIANETFKRRLDKLSDRISTPSARASKLLNKYKKYTTSDDLSSGVKRSSLKDRSPGERLFFACNIDMESANPIQVNFGPQLGLKLNSKLVFGTGMMLNMFSNDSSDHPKSLLIRPRQFHTFGSFDVTKSFFSYAEFYRSIYKNQPNAPEEKSTSNTSLLLGIGKKILISSKLYLSTLLTYDAFNENLPALHRGRFRLRVGLQLSELAVRKKQYHYHPNQ